MPEKKTRPIVLGFVAPVWQQMANRRLEGVLRYTEENLAEVGVRDYRFQFPFQDLDQSPHPSWRGTADGVILMFSLHGSVEKDIQWLLRGNVPMVSLAQEWSHPEIPVVVTDRAAVMKLAADFFAAQGYQNVAYVGYQRTLDIDQRRKLFDRRLAKYGMKSLAHDLNFVPRGEQEDQEKLAKEQGLIDLLRDSPKPLGLLTFNDDFAHALSRLCDSLKIDVPGEVGILGMGNLNSSRCNVPTISTIQLDNDRIGYEAARMLHRMILGQRPTEHTLFIPPLGIIERQSTNGQLTQQNDIKAACEYIRKHACEGIGVQEIVHKLSVSRRTFEQKFLEQTGQTPKQMIQQVRLDRAKHLLTHTSLSITQVASMTGFGSVAAFSLFCANTTGKSPSELREQG